MLKLVLLIHKQKSKCIFKSTMSVTKSRET